MSLTYCDDSLLNRAFMLFPMSFNIGVLIGPIMGGLLSNPATAYPRVFGNVQLLRNYPYLLPNLIAAIYLAITTLLVFFNMHEVYLYLICTCQTNSSPDTSCLAWSPRLG